jgi:hypothetical protein
MLCPTTAPGYGDTASAPRQHPDPRVDTANRSTEKGLQGTRTFVPYDDIIHVAETSGKGTARRPGRREPGR